MLNYIDTIVCEMIRVEMNNKLSLLGVYGRAIFIPQEPYFMPAFALCQRWSADTERPGDKVKIQVELAGETIENSTSGPWEVDIPSPPYPTIQIAIQLPGLHIKKAGDAEIHTVINGERKNTFRFGFVLPSAEQRAKLQGF